MRVRRLFGVGLLVAAAFGPLVPVLGSLRTSGRVIVTTADTVTEDLYAFGGRVIVEGTVEGDLVTFTNELTITGTVTGDVIGAVGGTADVSGVVGGSLRLAAVRLDVTGSVGDDVVGIAGDALVAADVGRDVLLVAGEVLAGGATGRDVHVQAWSLEVHGTVGRDVMARVDDIVVGPGATVAGDVEFQASDEVRVDDGAAVDGSLVRRDVLAPVWAKAVARAVLWLSLLGFLVGGLLAIWLFRRTMIRAAATALERPGRSALVGAGVVVGIPILVLPLGLSLVGLPVAVLLLVSWVVLLVLGAAPAVAAVGERIVGGRGGLAGGFVVGAVAWRAAMWVLALVAALVYLAATLVGIGAFAIAGWEQRREAIAADDDWRPLPPSGTGRLR
ncbi:MAG: hypothetical protein R3290_07200 [Acidimicrobiia bacterium]|nr:hypothetical protein [Acidimicrobiia bacterium]